MAVVLPPGDGTGGVVRVVAQLVGHGGLFAPVVLGPAGVFEGPGYRTIPLGWWPGTAAGRYARAVARVLGSVGLAVIEVHDAVEVAAVLGGMFRPVPVVLILHSDPQAQHGGRDAAARTYLLAQVTRVGAMSAELRARALEGVHPAMRMCAVLPSSEGPGGVAALGDALDALRADAREAWSRRLGGPI